MSLLEWLEVRYSKAKRTTFRHMIQARRILIDGRGARSLRDLVTDESRVEVLERDAPSRSLQRKGARRETRLPFTVVHDDEDILVIDKPPGLLTSTVPRERRTTALKLVRAHVAASQPRARVGLIHRLDRDASGLLIFSKSHASYISLKRQFAAHSVERVYTAIARGEVTPRRGRIESRLLELPDGRVVTTRHRGKGQLAITEYEVVAVRPGRSLLRVRLHTGRKHQIRAHFAERGNPILNDPIYDTENPAGRLMLAATELEITHPRTGKRIRFAIKVPRELSITPAESPSACVR